MDVNKTVIIIFHVLEKGEVHVRTFSGDTKDVKDTNLSSRDEKLNV